ncbi:hypothetical protein Cni_G14209 [Canna indica]|uniref:CCHC-type domain-containing protein n=1 Tax=Canna indica TaxID=4628 RepID=A0AAQ3KDQ1_9LILI|nr:hypothetical protein Cni_G14209 [Canna indica]
MFKIEEANLVEARRAASLFYMGFWIDTEADSFFQSIAYENLLFIWFKCGKIGHGEKECILSNDSREKKEREKKDVRKLDDKEESQKESLLGHWVQVHRRRRPSQAQNVIKNRVGNPFRILNNPTFEEELRNSVKNKEGNLSNILGQNQMTEKKKVNTSNKKGKDPMDNTEVDRVADIKVKSQKADWLKQKEEIKKMDIIKVNPPIGGDNSICEDVPKNFVFHAEKDKSLPLEVSKQKEMEEDELKVLSVKLTESFKKILENKNAEEDFLEEDISPEFSRENK